MNIEQQQIEILPLTTKHWSTVAEIYQQGINTRMATFETKVPSWEEWNSKYVDECRLVAMVNDQVVGWAALTPVSSRAVYRGVAEVSIYVDLDWSGSGVGSTLLGRLITASEALGYWTLQAGIFPENTASVRLHEKHGFRLVGRREQIAQLDGQWKDLLLFERRSQVVGV